MLSRKKTKKPYSLKWKLLTLVAMCWIIPVIALGGYCYIYYVKSVNEKSIDSASNEIYYSVCVAAGNIDSVIKTSRAITYDSTVADVYKRYLRGESHDDDLLRERVNRYLYSRVSREPLISYASIYFDEDPQRLYCYTGGGLEYAEAFQKETLPAVREFAAELASNVGFMNENGHAYIVRNLKDVIPEQGYINYATVVFELDRDVVFRELYSNNVWSGNMTYTINGCDGGVDGARLRLVGAAENAPQQSVKRDGDSFIFSGGVKKQDFTLGYSSEVAADRFNGEIQSYIWLMLALSAIILPIILLSLVFFYKNFTRPLHGLVEAGERLENGEFGYQITQEHINSEFSYLVQIFNRMSRQLQKLFDRVHKEEIANTDARILALQSQINPHFLNNTLELMNWQARFAGDNAVSKMIEALSTLMDAAMDRSGRRIIPLSEEVMCADAYLYIINQRFGKRLTVHKDIDRSLLSLEVPPLIIQPLLENAVEHGIEPVTNGNIYIKICKEGTDLVIEIANDGAKLSEKDLAAINALLNRSDGEEPKSSTSLGIRNVNDRLKLIYGEYSGLSIFSDEHSHTLSKVVIPIPRTEQENTTNVNFT